MQILYYILLTIICLYSLYFIIYGIIALFRRIKKPSEDSVKRHFAILIPATNEEMVVGNLLDSLAEQNYPKDKYDVYVVINNSTDHTEEIVEKHGVHVIDCHVPVHTKGDALHYAFRVLKKNKDVDYYIILDADNLADTDFLKNMNNACHGKDIVQGRRIGKNGTDNAISGCYEMFYVMQNIYFNHARTIWNQSAVLNGTGWAVNKQWLEETGYPVKTITEDLEFSAIAAMDHVKIGYAHDACTFDEYPNTFHKVFNQLIRWVFGQVQGLRYYEGRLLKDAFHGNYASWDMALVFIMPVITIFSVIWVTWTIFLPEGYPFIFTWMSQHFWVVALLSYFAVVLVCILGMLKEHLPVAKLLKGALLFPVFMMLWVPVVIICLFKRKVVWKPVEHDRAVRIEDIDD